MWKISHLPTRAISVGQIRNTVLESAVSLLMLALARYSSSSHCPSSPMPPALYILFSVLQLDSIQAPSANHATPM